MGIENQRDMYLNRQPMRPQSGLPYEEKEFYCNSCNIVHVSVGIPDNWLVVKRSAGPNENLKTITIVCSTQCLIIDAVKGLAKRAEFNNRGF